jgi:hypothetical protein
VIVKECSQDWHDSGDFFDGVVTFHMKDIKLLCTIVFGTVFTCIRSTDLAAQHLAQVADGTSRSGDVIATPAECFIELKYLRGLVNGQGDAWFTAHEVTTAVGGIMPTSALEPELVSEVTEYRDELLDALEAMTAPPRLSQEQVEGLKSQPIQPVSKEMVDTMKALVEDGAAARTQEVIRVAPFMNTEALEAWRRRAERMEEIRALREATAGLAEEVQIAALQSLDQANQTADASDQLKIEKGILRLDDNTAGENPATLQTNTDLLEHQSSLSFQKLP